MIYLKYGTWNNVTLQIDWSTEQLINELEYKETLTANRLNEVTLRGRRVSKLLNSSNVYSLVISADELADTAKYSFIKAFFAADEVKSSTNTDVADRWNENADATIKVYTIETDKLPVEFLENSKYLPEVKLELFQKEAN